MTADVNEWSVSLPAGLPLPTLNGRDHWAVRARQTKDIRTAAALLARLSRVPSLERAHVVGVLHPHDRRRRDPHNWILSLKPAIDGIVDSGVLPDDDAEHLISVAMILGEPVRGGQLEIRIRRAADDD